jgi:hypothetical protein
MFTTFTSRSTKLSSTIAKCTSRLGSYPLASFHTHIATNTSITITSTSRGSSYQVLLVSQRFQYFSSNASNNNNGTGTSNSDSNSNSNRAGVYNKMSFIGAGKMAQGMK